MSAPDSERLKALKAFLESDPNNSFTWYGIAMEYRSLGRIEEAADTFKKLIERDPKYVPAYHQLGIMLKDAGREDEARDIFKSGIAMADKVGNQHARDEMQGTLDLLD